MRYCFFLISIFFAFQSFSQTPFPYKEGEWLKYKIHFGPVNGGYATVAVNPESHQDNTYHVQCKEGWTVGMFDLFFNVEDDYQSYIDKETLKPLHFVRRVSEGGYKIKRDIYFDHTNKKAKVVDHKSNKTDTLTITDVQDMISSFYYMRVKNIDTKKQEDIVEIDMFFDKKTFPFKMQYLGREKIKTKFGKILCHKLKPMVQKGRVFKRKESLTFWVTADENKIPVRIKAALAVGSLKVDLMAYKGSVSSFNNLFLISIFWAEIIESNEVFSWIVYLFIGGHIM